MCCVAVFEVVVQAFLFAKPLDEVQVGLAILHAVFAFGVSHTELEAVGVAYQVMFFQYLLNNLLYCSILENTLIGTMPEPCQIRSQGD
ncbi:hypothetical protein ALP24_200081 [Pseudomonas syringae pv. aptata]|uniref:Uncharacterized protein n=1 Tax=Pseudomonas syringae pv. aptata TaxID=83167 RepID=A0A3M5WVR9_PSEAP|nr:hypothetical protein ALP24_200081 [Pseudomonas syringae pv. aptata]